MMHVVAPPVPDTFSRVRRDQREFVVTHTRISAFAPATWRS